MCARYTVFTEEEIIEMRSIIDEISRKFGSDAIGKGEIRPTNTAPVLALDNDRPAPLPVKWGFPKWGGKGVVINARSETAIEKPMFARPLLTRRCIIPSTGFFEWAPQPTAYQQISLLSDMEDIDHKAPKTKLLFRCHDEPMLYMAGMMDTFTGKDGKLKDAFVILTTAANASMSPFHDRMPVILRADEREDWLRSDAFMREVLSRVGPELVWEIAA